MPKTERKEKIMWKSECTGDYGLSDCLFVTDEAWDYAESWFTYSTPASSKEPTPYEPIDFDEDDLPF